MELIKFLKNYKGLALAVFLLGLTTNILALAIPKFSAKIIDLSIEFPGLNEQVLNNIYILIGIALLTLIVALIQIYISSIFAERVGYDLRKILINKVGDQAYSYITKITPAKLLTLITSDVDAVKSVIASSLVILLGAIVTLLGSIVFLLSINLRLGLYTVAVLPFLVLTFVLVFGKLSKLFQEGQENLEKINAVIAESVVGASLIRIFHATKEEIKKFAKVNTDTREVGFGIVKKISALIPVIIFLANTTTIVIVWFGGNAVMKGELTLGNLSAFLSYSALFIWPLFVLGFVGPMIGRGFVSMKRINEIVNADIPADLGTYTGKIIGDIEFKDVTLKYTDENGNEKTVLENISFSIKAGSKTAIIGPTAAGKTQIFYLLSGLIPQTNGNILVDNRPISEYDNSSYLSQVGLVFQDSIMFNSTFRENISLGEKAETNDMSLQKAIETAELSDFVKSLPRGLNTHVSERGTSLSGGQKQRLMLARALAVNPQILLLDDFTARVDRATEATILENVNKNYPNVTLVSITQKIEPIQNYDHIIVIMEGELVAYGKHEELLSNSLEYRQIYESQQSAEHDNPQNNNIDSNK